MATAALVLTLIGLVVTLIGGGWLLWGIDPADEKYNDDGPLYPGQQRSQVLPRFIQAQRRPTVLVVMGGVVQVAGGVLAIIAALQ
ncbi:hypothetical protein [Modestobacter sp. SSW1-42]|uniref:hypothetical protein n=1 Tax=Modestobacter sp. SSW1-42 TaxID=596372 RepID=UPI0039871758